MHIPLINLLCIQKGTTYSAREVCNKLPLYIKKFQHDNLHKKLDVCCCVITCNIF
jgi:hypothetical protein